MMELTADQAHWKRVARQFAEEHIRPISLERDRIDDPRETFDWDVIRKGSELGFRTAVVPEEFGGHGIDAVSQVAIMSELARGDSAVSKTFSQCWKWSQLLAARCTDEQKQRFLVPFVADHTFLLGKAGTEPDAGSDNRVLVDDPRAGWRMSAIRDGDEWILNGVKRYIANGGVAKLYIVDTRTDPSASIREGTTVFAVPADTPGLRIGKVHDKVGWRFYQNAELVFEDARVAHANVIGEVNGGFAVHGGDAAEFGDLELAANALGVCDAAFEMALGHARTRWQGGKPIVEHQAISLRLSEMHMLTEALRAFVFVTAAEVDRGITAHKNPLMTFSTDVIQRVTHLNMDIHGGAGVMRDVGVDKLVRDSLIWTHLAGDSVQRMRAVDGFPD